MQEAGLNLTHVLQLEDVLGTVPLVQDHLDRHVFVSLFTKEHVHGHSQRQVPTDRASIQLEPALLLHSTLAECLEVALDLLQVYVGRQVVVDLHLGS